jgi:cyanophycinase-like exopeptidase
MSTAGSTGSVGSLECRILAIMGSGETSPTMVGVHKELVARLGRPQPVAVVLDTPYAFQENAPQVSAKARAYFARSVGLTVSVASAADSAAEATQSVSTRAGRGPSGGAEARAIRTADWLFAGPGSPSYALARWRASGAAEALRDRVAAGTGITVLASAAAATAGLVAVPVYEIYKVGVDPHWLPGLDLMGLLGLPVAVIPHFDNAEGGTHDTRYCYLGERRLALMERELPGDAAVLGVDEHTAAIFDLAAQTLTVAGRGGVTIRRQGSAMVLPASTVIPLARLRALVTGQVRFPGAGPTGAAALPADQEGAAKRAVSLSAGPPGPALAGAVPLPLPELTRECERRFEQAAASRDAEEMVSAVLDLEDAIHSWASDTEEDQGTEQARAVLRGLIARLGAAAREGLRDPADLLRPVVEPLLGLRRALRAKGRYPDADAIRNALTAAGLTISDTPSGTLWHLCGTRPGHGEEDRAPAPRPPHG